MQHTNLEWIRVQRKSYRSSGGQLKKLTHTDQMLYDSVIILGVIM